MTKNILKLATAAAPFALAMGIATPASAVVVLSPSPYTTPSTAVLTTGAYNYTMASNYNRVPRPPVVFVKDGESRVVVKRETYEYLYHLDV